MFLGKDHIFQPSEIWKRVDQIVLENSLQGKTLSENLSSTVPAVDSAVPMPDIMIIFASMILMGDIYQMIPILAKRYSVTIQDQHQPLN